MINFLKILFKDIFSLSLFWRRIILIIIDIFLISLSIYFSNQILQVNSNGSYDLLRILFLTYLLAIPIYIFTGQYKSLTRYIGGFSFYSLLGRNLFIFNIVYLSAYFLGFKLPGYNTIILFILINSSLSVILRYSSRDMLLLINKIDSSKKRQIPKCAIYGAGSAGAQLGNNLRLSTKYDVITYFDDDKTLWNRTLNGVQINPPFNIEFYVNKIDIILIAIPSLTKEKKFKLFKKLNNLGFQVLQVPSFEEITSGEESINNLKPITLEDLLGREKIYPNKYLLDKAIKNKSVCVIGAGGSIGGEICRQIIKFAPKKIVLIDNNEPSIYKVEKDLLKKNYSKNNIFAVLGNAMDYKLIKYNFQKYEIDLVLNAAAFKHVPLVEKNPLEGIKNNVFSTIAICKAVKDSNVKQLIYISSDKAVRPTNVMGASKRLSELIVQSFSNEIKYSKDIKKKLPIFSMVRFGNVLGSSGSVIPLFKEQIAEGGPITLTDPNVVRYFMTIQEASQLVLQSAELAKGGDIFLLDMGKPVLIKELAEQMIKLAGYEVRGNHEIDNNKDTIEIITTGLRPGEKLYEELLIDGDAVSTDHPLIFKTTEKSISKKQLDKKISQLEISIKNLNLNQSLKILKELVPEWQISNLNI